MAKTSVGITLLIAASALFTGGCQDRGKAARVRFELIDGVQHVFNSGEPLRGRIPLEVSEVLRIDPDHVSLDHPPLFQSVAKDEAGNIFLTVKRFTGLDSVEIDLIDGQGRLAYTVVPSAAVPDLRNATIFGKTIGLISEVEEKNIYIEYRWKYPKGPFE